VHLNRKQLSINALRIHIAVLLSLTEESIQ